MNNKNEKPQRGTGQKIAVFFSVYGDCMSLVSVVFSIYWNMNFGTESPIFASALACIFFFLSCGFVLQYISNAIIPTFEQPESE